MEKVQHGKSVTLEKNVICMKKVQQQKSATRKKWNMKKVQHEEKIKLKDSEKREESVMEKVRHEESATLKECNTKKALHEKSAKQKSATRRKHIMRKMQHAKNATRDRMQHDQSIVTEWNFKKIVQKECTWMHKQITGRPLTDRYRLLRDGGK